MTTLGRIGATPLGKTNASYPLGVETIISSKHPWPPKPLSVSGRLDYGGEMTLLRTSREIHPTVPVRGTGVGGFITDGTSFVTTVIPSASTPVPISGSIMNAIGAKGWNRYKPTARKAGLDQFLGELKQLPRAFAINAYKNVLKEIANGRFGNVSPRSVSKHLADDYLNFRFGWMPFYSDIKELLNNFLEEDKLFKQLVRDNGRPVRRSGIVDTITDTQSTTTQGLLGPMLFPALQTQFYDKASGTQTTTTQTKEEYAFSGRFRYYIPQLAEGPDSEVARRRARRIIYGAELTPNTLYQLMPWSWLIDWISPIGDVISNLNDYGDNLTADYAYATGNRSRETVVVVNGILKGIPITAYSSALQEVKLRRRASPFGFGLNPGSFSPYQLSILAALGISKYR